MNTGTISKAAILRERDFFIHDGSHLRRLRFSIPMQMALLALTALLLGWSTFATVRLFTATAPTQTVSAPNADIARLAAATETRVQQIEQRQKILAAMLSGEKVSPEIIAQLGYHLPTSSEQMGVGGPFDSASQGDPTFKSLFSSWKKLDNLADGAIAVPSEKPVRTAAFTSGYGVRSDPFKGGAARHMGIDLAGPVGTPIYATADGIVEEAGWNSGGYGNLVKVGHGKGIETRYGHMSAILVKAGQRVTRGQQIGRMGSTGRSTGSHLHYEVRIDGRAVNPIPFMKSNDYLLAMQQNGGGTHSMDAVALGGPAGGKR